MARLVACERIRIRLTWRIRVSDEELHRGTVITTNRRDFRVYRRNKGSDSDTLPTWTDVIARAPGVYPFVCLVA